MRSRIFTAAVGALIVVLCPPAFGQGVPADDPVRVLVGRLDLESYKATIKGLTGFGDRRQGTDRNRAAVDWIERQLKSFGCNTARIKYDYDAQEPKLFSWRSIQSDRKSTRLNSSHRCISYAVFCLKKKKNTN